MLMRVKYPGHDPLSKDSKLSTVIEWCGGFTEYASLQCSSLSRYGSREDVELEKLLSLRGTYR